MKAYEIRTYYCDEPMRFIDAKIVMKWLIKHRLINDKTQCAVRIAPLTWGKKCTLKDIFGDNWKIGTIYHAEELLTDIYYTKDGIDYKILEFTAEPIHFITDENDDYFNDDLGYKDEQ